MNTQPETFGRNLLLAFVAYEFATNNPGEDYAELYCDAIDALHCDGTDDCEYAYFDQMTD